MKKLFALLTLILTAAISAMTTEAPISGPVSETPPRCP